MARYFHGTTIDNALTMMIGDFSPQTKPSGTWNCSDDGCCLYLYSLDKYNDNCCDEGEDCNAHHIIEQAFDSAQITAALNNILRSELVVFEFEFELLEDDFSCPNMADVASVAFLNNITVKDVINIHICKDG